MNQTVPASAQQIARFCGQCSCGCPELWYNPHATDELKRVIITDDHGQGIELSIVQLDDLYADLGTAIATLKAHAGVVPDQRSSEMA
jgi:hypothetical protein